MSPSILVTGGTGYIGSHTVVELVNSGLKVVLGNLTSSPPSVVDGLRRICGERFSFVEADVRAPVALDRVFQGHAGVRRLVFGSSATAYGDPQAVPVDGTAPRWSTNPYVQTKLVCEDVLRSLQAAVARWNIAVLRYLKPAAAHESGLMRDKPVPFSYRPGGDEVSCHSDVRVSRAALGWAAGPGLERICMDAWRWQSRGARWDEVALRNEVDPDSVEARTTSMSGAL